MILIISTCQDKLSEEEFVKPIANIVGDEASAGDWFIGSASQTYHLGGSWMGTLSDIDISSGYWVHLDNLLI